MIKSINQVYALTRPGTAERHLPIVIDSPHSGTTYPFNTGIVAPPEALNTTWDAFVDELWSGAPGIGAPLLAARFPRAYIDPNRAPDDIDDTLLDEPWPTPLAPSAACKRGMGLIRLNALPGVPMYAGKLSTREIKGRLDQYYLPYHSVLKAQLDTAHERFGKVWHINCHSMKSVGNAMNVDNGAVRPDIVVSDRNGTSASSEFTEWVARCFDAKGYKVLINTPYQGGYIVTNYGAPQQGRHSVQVEIKRGTYMDEKTFEKNEGFDVLQRDINGFLQELAQYAAQRLEAQA
ncbi:N-formylglutamate amidohydrolase [Herbaspirillum sp. YR522]|uniref:N-formylglutamate amidohydrolase n=1 Tax=Herbaspirillum sp. YR522 TaxID=1144342 RepID=UPI00026F9129|nr:N-formylglutamate amidohydrolase [Herbaspirillum sp. YR522]EJN02910.1 N-formylglutamate amidohydrolase [Herbaspirillum sp. YR522]